MTGKRDIAAEIAALKGDKKPETPPSAPPAPKLENSKDLKKNGYGGRRAGSGRKPLALDDKKRTLKQLHEDFALEDDEVQRIDKGTGKVRREKMKKARVVLEALYKQAKTGDVSAIKEFNDRILGKSKQPITGGDEDDTPLRLDVDITSIVNKVYGPDADGE